MTLGKLWASISLFLRYRNLDDVSKHKLHFMTSLPTKYAHVTVLTNTRGSIMWHFQEAFLKRADSTGRWAPFVLSAYWLEVRLDGWSSSSYLGLWDDLEDGSHVLWEWNRYIKGAWVPDGSLEPPCQPWAAYSKTSFMWEMKKLVFCSIHCQVGFSAFVAKGIPSWYTRSNVLSSIQVTLCMEFAY